MNRIKLLPLILLLVACGPNEKQTKEIKELQDSLQISKKQVELLENNIRSLRDSLSILKFPADQRLTEINELVNNNELGKAKKAIANLKKIFPKSNEAKLCDNVTTKIEDLERKAKEEEDRIKALGFKAIPQQVTFKIDYNKVVLSDIKIGKTYIHDDYGSEYRYNEADRGYKYVLVTMTVTSDINDPKIPDLQIYSINGGEMSRETFFYTNFARWDDYGSYLGNDHDFGNDFAKKGTVKFKLAAEVTDDVISGKFAIICKKENTLKREVNRYGRPAVKYSGSTHYDYILTPESFKEEYIIVKTFNL